MDRVSIERMCAGREFLESRLLHINVHKYSGPDGLPSGLLRDLAPLLSQPLAARPIFNASLRSQHTVYQIIKIQYT